MDPEVPGSFTHPDLSRMLYADGKVVTPLYKGRLREERVDKKTGEIRQVRYEPTIRPSPSLTSLRRRSGWLVGWLVD
jgi:hypothetical protein